MAEIRIVDTTVLTAPGQAVVGEFAWSPTGGTISYLGPTRGPAGPADWNGRDRLIIPGLVNGHTHAGMAMLRGYSDDVPLHTWLEQVRAVEVRMTSADIQAGLTLALAEMMRTGTVGFLDMFEWSGDLVGAVVDAGMRVWAAPAVFGYDAVAFPAARNVLGAGTLDATPRLAAEFAGEPTVTVGYGLHAPYTCSPELIADVAGRRRSDGLGVQIHLSETRREVVQSMARHGVSPIRLVHDLGLLDGRVHVAHAVHPHEGDTELLAREGVSVAHNPVSNLKLGAGIAPVPGYLRGGVRLCLGTDSVASNNTLDLFEEIKTGTLIHRAVAEDPEVIGGAEVFAMATSGGARALDQGLSGTLSAGAAADFVLLDVSGIVATPLTDPMSFVSYAAGGHLVTDVVVNGREVVRNGRCVTIDEESARADVAERAARIRGEIRGT